jgi:hypothetical protein
MQAGCAFQGKLTISAAFENNLIGVCFAKKAMFLFVKILLPG